MEVLLVGLSDDLEELRALVASAGYALRSEFVQRRPRPDPKWFVGKGKLEELKKRVKETGVPVVVFAGTLRPSQVYELEKALKAQCYDRLRVILEIFTQRAHSREARLQVELAMLQYEIPILKEWIHSGTAGERPGFMAGGEYRVDAYYETVKRRMKRVRDELDHVRKERAVRRDLRQERGFYQVSLCGYANAGKSSLFNALSGEQVAVEDRLFTTLSTTTRALHEVKRRILLTDTVGFVSNVPLWLVEAFHSTFEEVYASDLVLLLLDAADSGTEFQAKLDLAAGTLLPGTEVERVQPVLAKIDLVDGERVEECKEAVHGSPFSRAPIAVSTNTGEGLETLRAFILTEFRRPVELVVYISRDKASPGIMSWLYERTDVIAVLEREGEIEVRLRCHERDVGKIEHRARATRLVT